MNQIERITYYEKILNKGEDVCKRLIEALDDFLEYDKKIKELDEYYNGSEIREDIEADEAGRLPKDLNRGVLGEDYTWDLLTTWDAIKNKINK